MSMKYIRSAYNVPAKRGGRVEYTDSNGQKFRGTIVSAKEGHLCIKLDGLRHTQRYHPTWNLVYLDGAK